MSAALASPTLVPLALCLASATFYVAGTAAMKLLGHVPFPTLMLPVGAAFILAAWFEVAVLRGARLGHVFLLIFAFEVILTSLLAVVLLNERYSMRETLGLATIVAGVVLLAASGEAPGGDAETPARADAPPPTVTVAADEAPRSEDPP